MTYEIKYRETFDTIGQARTVVQMLISDGWSENSFEIVQKKEEEK